MVMTNLRNWRNIRLLLNSLDLILAKMLEEEGFKIITLPNYDIKINFINKSIAIKHGRKYLEYKKDNTWKYCEDFLCINLNNKKSQYFDKILQISYNISRLLLDQIKKVKKYNSIKESKIYRRLPIETKEVIRDSNLDIDFSNLDTKIVIIYKDSYYFSIYVFIRNVIIGTDNLERYYVARLFKDNKKESRFIYF